MAKKFGDSNTVFLNAVAQRAADKALRATAKGMSPAAAALARSGKGGGARQVRGMEGEN